MRWALLYCACPCALSYTAVAGPAWPHAPTTASPQPRPLGVTPRRPLLRARVRPPVALFSFEPLFDSADPRLGQDLLSSEASWLLLASLGVLALGQCFEVIVHNFRRIVPRRLRAVLEAILGELTTLGFTGLVLGAIHDSSALDALSSTYLGEPEELYELIELVDASLFPAVVSYLLSCALLVGIVNVQFAAFKRSTQNELLLARLTDDAEREACRGEGAEEEGCIVAQSRAQKVHGLLLSSMVTPGAAGVRVSPFHAIEELFKSPAVRRAEFLRFRSRFIEQSNLDGWNVPDDLPFGIYLQETAALNLRGLVTLEPIQLAAVWLPLVLVETLALWLGGGASGDYLPSLMILAQLPIGVWATWNYARLHHIKAMLLPQMGVLSPSGTDGKAGPPVYKLLPPRAFLLGGAFRRSTGSLFRTANVFERIYASVYKPTTATVHEELFGTLGSLGPTFYLSSMKLVLFSAVVSIAYIGSGGAVEFTDSAAAALAVALASPSSGLAAIAPSLTSSWTAEALTPSLEVLLPILSLLPALVAVVLAPYSLLCFNWATSLEGLRRRDLLDTVLSEQRSDRFHVTLAYLASLCGWIEQGLAAYRSTTCSFPVQLKGSPIYGSAAEVDEMWAHMRATTPPERLVDARAVFDSMDPDGSGTICSAELGAVVAELGFEVTDDELEGIFSFIDVDRSGDVGYKEFVTAVGATPPGWSETKGEVSTSAGMPTTAEENALFKFFDGDGSGLIDEAEMLQKLTALGFDLRGVRQLFSEIGGDRLLDRRALDKGQFLAYLRTAPSYISAGTASPGRSDSFRWSSFLDGTRFDAGPFRVRVDTFLQDVEAAMAEGETRSDDGRAAMAEENSGADEAPPSRSPSPLEAQSFGAPWGEMVAEEDRAEADNAPR